MKKYELLRALREEIQRHNLDTFMSADKIVQTGCSTCRKRFGTIQQFKQHLTDDVLPPLLDRLSKGWWVSLNSSVGYNSRCIRQPKA